MLISSATPQVRTPQAQAQVAQKPEMESLAGDGPKESFSFSSASSGGHYSGGKVLTRMATGALTGLGAHYFTGGSVGGTALLGAAINGGAGAIVGGAAGAVIGGVGTGNPVPGAVVGALAGGAVGAGTGALKGAAVALVGNAFGGGPIAFAAAGATFGAIGL